MARFRHIMTEEERLISPTYLHVSDEERRRLLIRREEIAHLRVLLHALVRRRIYYSPYQGMGRCSGMAQL
jgi:hypothetical protein